MKNFFIVLTVQYLQHNQTIPTLLFHDIRPTELFLKWRVKTSDLQTIVPQNFQPRKIPDTPPQTRSGEGEPKQLPVEEGYREVQQ